MGIPGTRKLISVLVLLAAVAGGLVIALSGSSAGARTPRQVRTEPILTVPRGGFELTLGTSPAWLPLSDTVQTLTLIGGAPPHGGSANAYVAFVRASRPCGAAPAGARPIYAFDHFYSSAHSAARHAGAFAPDGGAPRSTYLESLAGVKVSQGSGARACVWLADSPASHARSLAASIPVPLLNRTFAASVSNLTGASAGSGGLTMFAFDGGHAFRYSAASLQCGRSSRDGAATVGAATPGSEAVSINTSPCSGDQSSFSFSGTGVRAQLTYPFMDALASPPITVSTGACELDPLVGVTLTQAEQYLAAVGCRVGRVLVSPYEKPLIRGDVAWASVQGGVAEIAPRHTAVDLVLNGRP